MNIYLSRLAFIFCIIFFICGMAVVKAQSDEDYLRQHFETVSRLFRAGKYTEALPHAEKFMNVAKQLRGGSHPTYASALNTMSSIHQAMGMFSDAEILLLKAISILHLSRDIDPVTTSVIEYNLAKLYMNTSRFDRAEPIMRRVLSLRESRLGNDHPLVWAVYNDLAVMYSSQQRFEEAEGIYLRVISFYSRPNQDHLNHAMALANIAGLYNRVGKYSEATRYFNLSIDIMEINFGHGNIQLADLLDNYSETKIKEGKYSEGERLLKTSMEIYTKLNGANHRTVGNVLSGLASLRLAQGRNFKEAEVDLRRALRIYEGSHGNEHPNSISAQVTLSQLRFAQKRWPEAYRLLDDATHAYSKRVQTIDPSALTTGGKNIAQTADASFKALAKSAYRSAQSNQKHAVSLMRSTFERVQWSSDSPAAGAIAQTAARNGTEADLGQLVRERQDLVSDWQQRERLRDAAYGRKADKRDGEIAVESTTPVAAIETRIAKIDAELKAKFPEYAAFASPAPVAAADVQKQLGEDEALVLFLDTAEAKPTPEETFIWVVTKTEMRWARSDLGTVALTRLVQALRCGLDDDEWTTQTRKRRCADLLRLTDDLDQSQPLPFDLGKAHDLYKALFGQVEDLIRGKRLLIVSSGPLTSLPFHVLVTKKPETALPQSFEVYRDVAWLGKQNAVVTLPAVSSLNALRQHAAKGVKAADDYAGYGNPVLMGDGASCRLPKVLKTCPAVEATQRPTAPATTAAVGSERATTGGRGGRRSVHATTDEMFAKGATAQAVLEQVRSLCPLPDTAYEINCIAERFREKARLVRLGGDARETDLKAMSKDGKLARYRVLHFATHGLLSGDVERMALRQGEPALVLTPPDKPANDDDDGLLTASEVATLKLNADWIVLSACNTAAGEKIGSEALSGLAKAFFYAGGRALLVSHWPVYSDAAVQLTSRTFAELDSNPKSGRAEALQQAMIALMEDTSQSDNAHPAVWAPFVIVGEGAR